MHTVASVLDLPVLRAGLPEVLSGHDRLGDPVRWVHVSEQLDGADLLDGGELVLATGLFLESRPDRAARHVQDLQDAGAAGLVVELLPGREPAERTVRDAARDARMPVVLLHRRVRFIDITETVHSALVADQLAQVRAQQAAHELFTDLSLRAADPQEVVAAAARLTGRPVAMQDPAGRVLRLDPGCRDPEEVLGALPADRRDGWLQVPVRTGEHVWAWLRAPADEPVGPEAPVPAEEGAAARALAPMVLERAAQTLAINEMTRRDQGVLARQARATCLEEIRAGHLDRSRAATRARAVGLAATGRFLPLAVRVRADGTPEEVQRRTWVALDALESAVAALGLTHLASPTRHDLVSVVLALPPDADPDAVATRLAGTLRASGQPAGPDGQGTPDGPGCWVGVGDAVPDLVACVGALDEATHVADSAASVPDLVARPFYRAADVRVRGVLATLVEDPAARRFVAAELGELRRPDRAEDLRLLELYLELGGAKTELARRTYLSRPTLYARLRRLSGELGADLESGESRTSLHVAVLLLRQEQARERSASGLSGSGSGRGRPSPRG